MVLPIPHVHLTSIIFIYTDIYSTSTFYAQFAVTMAFRPGLTSWYKPSMSQSCRDFVLVFFLMFFSKTAWFQAIPFHICNQIASHARCKGRQTRIVGKVGTLNMSQCPWMILNVFGAGVRCDGTQKGLARSISLSNEINSLSGWSWLKASLLWVPTSSP